MKLKFFTSIMVTILVIFIGGCASSREREEDINHDDESNYAPALNETGLIMPAVPEMYAAPDENEDAHEETHEIHTNEAEFMSELKEAGLNWVAEERLRPLFRFDYYNQLYFITCPARPILGIVNIRSGGGFWGDGHIRISFDIDGERTEEELNRFREEGMLTQDEWYQFAATAGRVLHEEAYASSLGTRFQEYFLNFPFYYYQGSEIVAIEGLHGNIDYRIRLSWNPFYSMYAGYRMDLTVGLAEVIREHFIDIGGHP